MQTHNKVKRTIGVVALSGPTDLEILTKGIEKLKALGFNVILSDNAKAQGPLYLAGSDADRVAGLHAMFQNPEVDLIMCTKGGYGTPRLTSLIDFKLIKNHPKPLIGYSDVSYILNLIHHHTGLTTYHGPMVCGDFTKDYTTTMFQNLIAVLDHPTLTYDFSAEKDVETLQKGIAQGTLIGGNLCLMTVLLQAVGIPYFKDTILLLEDVNEPLYELDRLLTTLAIGGVFKHVNGVIIGHIKPVNDESEADIKALFKHVLAPLNIPVLYGVPFSHVAPRRTIPIGTQATLDATLKTMVIDKAHHKKS